MFPANKSVHPSSSAQSTALRIPPNSLDAEASVLGALLINNASYDEISEMLSESDFYSPKHGIIYKAITSQIMTRNPADVVTIQAHLERTGQAIEIGGITFLNQLANSVSSSANIRSWADIVADKSVRRSLITAGEKISNAAYTGTETSTEDLHSNAEIEIAQVGASKSKSVEHDSINTLVCQFLDDLTDPNPQCGVQTGFTEIDALTNGFQPGQLIVIAGRPSMGKTALAMNIAEHNALKQKLPVLVISLEMSAGQLVKRLIGSIAKIDQSRLRDDLLRPGELQHICSVGLTIRESKLDILDRSSCASTVAAIRRCARQVSKKHGGLGMVVVDYLQLMGSDNPSVENRTNEVSNISRGLKILAGELGCPVFALSQLNRGVEQRPDKRPMMSDLRESGAIEQDADIIMFIYRDDYYTKQESKCPGVAEVNIAKQRNGAVGTVNLAWTPAYTRFDNLA